VAPWADVLYFADQKWWEWHRDGIQKSWPWVTFTKEEVKKRFSDFAGQKVTIEHKPMATGPDILWLRNDGSDGLCEKQDGIRTGANSGYQALNIAALSGSKRVLLVGYDMNYQGGRSHAHNGHPVKMHESAYHGYAKKFQTLESPLKKLGIEVRNCTPDSRISCFKHEALEQALACVPTV
jgi:hypothetical protein